MNESVPVIMYHSIGIPNKEWQWNFLTCPFEIFENQIRYLKRLNFNTIFLQDLYDYMNGCIKLPKNPIIISFDDGYLDNWLFAYPILKKYGFKATIYISPEFIDTKKTERKNLENVWNKELKLNDIDCSGYLSWKELKIMEKSDHIDVQSHTMTHTWYPKNNKIIDFRHPKDPYIWMTWNNHRNNKPYLQVDNPDLVDYGEPVYENDRSLGSIAYLPDKELNSFLVNYVMENPEILNSKLYKKKLSSQLKEYYTKSDEIGRYETQSEYEKRIYYELQKSKQIIENKLNKEVKFVCWPGGAVTNKSLEIAKEVGYLSSTVGRDLKEKRTSIRNSLKENPSRINRISPINYWDGKENANSNVVYSSGPLLMISINKFKNNDNKFNNILEKGFHGYYKFKYEILKLS